MDMTKLKNKKNGSILFLFLILFLPVGLNEFVVTTTLVYAVSIYLIDWVIGFLLNLIGVKRVAPVDLNEDWETGKPLPSKHYLHSNTEYVDFETQMLWGDDDD